LDAKVFGEIVAEDGSVVLEELPRGEIGQLFVRGSSVFQRYFNPENDGGAKLYPGTYRDDNWLATGDLFMQDENGFLYFKGRAKDLIKQRGFCLYPRDLESIVYRNPMVEICAVAGVIDGNGNEIAKLFVTLVEQDKQTQDEFKAWLNLNIDQDYMFGEIQFVDDAAMQLQLVANECGLRVAVLVGWRWSERGAAFAASIGAGFSSHGSPDTHEFEERGFAII